MNAYLLLLGSLNQKADRRVEEHLHHALCLGISQTGLLRGDSGEESLSIFSRLLAEFSSFKL